MYVSNVSAHETRRLAVRRHSCRGNLLLTAVIALPAVLAGLVAFSSLSRPTDAELAARFRVHEEDFQRLVVMLHADGSRLSGTREALGLEDLVATGANGESYRLLLARIGATDLQYFPISGCILLPLAASDVGFTGMSKFYLYTGSAQSRPLFHAQRYSLRAPYAPTNGDLHILGGWFVHREDAVAALSAPY